MSILFLFPEFNSITQSKNWKLVANSMRKRQLEFEKLIQPRYCYADFCCFMFFVVTIMAVLERFYYNYMPDVTSTKSFLFCNLK
jgi:hypothetical protein